MSDHSSSDNSDESGEEINLDDVLAYAKESEYTEEELANHSYFEPDQDETDAATAAAQSLEDS